MRWLWLLSTSASFAALKPFFKTVRWWVGGSGFFMTVEQYLGLAMSLIEELGMLAPLQAGLVVVIAITVVRRLFGGND